MKNKQWQWSPRGWFVFLTIRSRDFGFGFSAHAVRFNGVDIFLGPITLTIQPPMPTPLGDAILAARPELKTK